MFIENNRTFLLRLINKQFEMIGIDMRYENLPDDGKILPLKSKRREYWYEIYTFNDEKEYLLWRNWMREEIAKEGYTNVESESMYIDLRYGMNHINKVLTTELQ